MFPDPGSYLFTLLDCPTLSSIISLQLILTQQVFITK